MTRAAVRIFASLMTLILCGFSPPEQPQEWRYDAVNAVPGTLTLRSYRTAYPRAYWEQYTHPGPYPIPRLTCSMRKELTLSVEWRHDKLPPPYHELDSYLSQAPLLSVRIDDYSSISDERFSIVKIMKMAPDDYSVSSDFMGASAIELLQELWATGVTPVTVLHDGGRLEWFLDFRASADPVSKVLEYCGIDADSVFHK